LVMIGDVDYVGDFLPRRGAQGVLSENAQRHSHVAANENLPIIRRALPHRTLGRAKPRPHGKSKLFEPFAPDIDPQLLRQRESKTGDAVVEHSAVDVKVVFVDEHAWRQVYLGHVASAKRLAGVEFAHSIEAYTVEFTSNNDEID